MHDRFKVVYKCTIVIGNVLFTSEGLLSMKLVKSVFMLTDTQLQNVEHALSLDYLIALVRPGFSTPAQYVGGLQDFFIHFYYEESPLYNSELTLIYMTRYEIIQAFAKAPTVKSMKAMTANHLERALFAAILCTNIYVDIFCHFTKPQLKKEHRQFHEAFSNADSQHFFDKSFQNIESYPKLFVYVQSEIIKLFWTYIRTEHGAFEKALAEAKQLLQAYTLTEIRLFEDDTHHT